MTTIKLLESILTIQVLSKLLILSSNKRNDSIQQHIYFKLFLQNSCLQKQINENKKNFFDNFVADPSKHI